MKMKLVLLWPAALLAGALAFGQGSAKDTAEFQGIIERYYAAWSKLSTDAPAEYYAKDAGLVFYDIVPLEYVGWEAYKAGVQKNFFDQMTSAKLTPNKDLRVARRGNVTWTTVTFHLSGKMKSGQPMELDGRHTAIWERRGGRWLIVHEHVSAPLPSQ